MKPILYPATALVLDGLTASPAGTYIFRGPRAIGKMHAARWMATRVLCESGGCANCRDCKLVASGAHPAMTEVSPDDKSIGIDQVKALQQNLKLSGYSKGMRFAVINEADTLTIQAQNALLKLLEEPPVDTSMILISHGGDVLLPTILSRSRVINFTRLDSTQINTYLSKIGVSGEMLAKIVGWAGGLPGLATMLAQDEAMQERYAQADEAVEDMLKGEPFERLTKAATIAEEPELLSLFTGRLAVKIGQLMREGSDALKQAKALERYRYHRTGNVAAKSALESLVLDL